MEKGGVNLLMNASGKVSNLVNSLRKQKSCMEMEEVTIRRHIVKLERKGARMRIISTKSRIKDQVSDSANVHHKRSQFLPRTKNLVNEIFQHGGCLDESDDSQDLPRAQFNKKILN